MVAHADRWSRDNAASHYGLDLLQGCGVRFYIGEKEQDLFDPTVRLNLGIAAEVGRYQAHLQSKKSIESRIHRAERGIPTVGRRPYGRIYNRETGTWELDAEKVAIARDVAKRYIAGESFSALCAEYGLSEGPYRTTLSKKCGEEWTLHFKSKALKIDRKVTMKVPRVLDEATIEAFRERARRNTSCRTGRIHGRYLLGGLAYCSECGTVLTGQRVGGEQTYYRHCYNSKGGTCTVRPRHYVRCDVLDEAVMRHLFDLFGNPAEVVRAIERAQPDPHGTARLRDEADRLRARVAKLETGRDRILKLIVDDKLTHEQAAGRLDKVAAEEAKLNERLADLTRQLHDVPDPADVRAVAERACAVFAERAGRVSSKRRQAAYRETQDYEGMSAADRRALVEMVFVGRTPDGQPAGVYVTPIPGQSNHRRKDWAFKLSGLLVDAAGTTAAPPWSEADPEDGPQGGPRQADLLDARGRGGAPRRVGKRGRGQCVTGVAGQPTSCATGRTNACGTRCCPARRRCPTGCWSC